MNIDMIKNIFETYKLDQFIFLIPILVVGLWFGFIGFCRGIRKESYKVALGLSLLMLSVIFLGPISKFLFEFNIRFIVERANISQFWDPTVFTGSISLQGLIEFNIEKYGELQLYDETIKTINAIALLFIRIVVLIIMLFVISPILNTFISFFRWLFFRDKIKIRKIEKMNEKITEEAEDDMKLIKFKKHRISGWTVGFIYGMLVCTLLMMPLISFVGTVNSSFNLGLENEDLNINEDQNMKYTQAEITAIVDDIVYFTSKLEKSAFLSLINKTTLDDKIFDTVFYIENAQNMKKDIRKEFELFGQIYGYYTTNSEKFEQMSIETILSIMASSEVKEIFESLSESEMMIQLLNAGIHEAFKIEAVKDAIRKISEVDFEFLEKEAIKIDFSEEIFSLSKILTSAGKLLEGQNLTNLNYLGLDEVLFNDLMDGLIDSKLICNIGIPLGLEMAKNQNFILDLVENSILTNEELNDLFNEINSSVFNTIGSLYTDVVELDLDSTNIKEELTSMSDEQYSIFNNIIDTLYDNELFSKITTLGVKYFLLKIEEFKGINFEDSIAYAEDIKKILEGTKVIFRNENFDVNNLEFELIFNSLSETEILTLKNSITELSVLKTLAPGIGLFIQNILGDTFYLPEKVDWVIEISNIFDVFCIIRKYDVKLNIEDPTSILTNLLTLDDTQIMRLGQSFGKSELFISIVKSQMETLLAEQKIELNFNEVSNWGTEIGTILVSLKPFGDFSNIDFSDLGSLLGKIKIDSTCDSILLVQAISNLVRPFSQGEDRVIEIVLDTENNQTYNDYMKIHLKDLLNSALILLYDDISDSYLDLANLDITSLLKKFYHDETNLLNPLEKREKILKSDILYNTVIFQLKKAAKTMNELVIPDDIKWKDEGAQVGELNVLLNSMEHLLPSGNMDDLKNVNDIIVKLYDDIAMDVILQSRIINCSVRQMIEDMALQENPMIYIPFGMTEGDWELELKLLITSLKIITLNSEKPNGYDNFEEINLNKSIQKFKDKENRNTLLNSRIIEQTIKVNLDNNSQIDTTEVKEDEWDFELDYFFDAIFIILGESLDISDINLNESIQEFKNLDNRKTLLKSQIIETTIKVNLKKIDVLDTSRVEETKWDIELEYFFNSIFLVLNDEIDLSKIDINLNIIIKERTTILSSIILETTIVREIREKNQISNISIPTQEIYQDYIEVKWYRNYLNDSREVDESIKSELDFLLDSVSIILTDEHGIVKDIALFDVNNAMKKFVGDEKNLLLKSDIIKATIISNLAIDVIKKDNFMAKNENKIWTAWQEELPRILDGINVILGENNLNDIVFDLNKILEEESRNILLTSRILEETVVFEIKKQVQLGGSLNTVIRLPQTTDYNGTAPEIQWYRNYKTDHSLENESEVGYLLAALKTLIGSNEDIAKIEIGKLMSVFKDEEKQGQLLKSIIVKNTVISYVEEANLLVTTRMQTWNHWSFELPKFFAGITSLIGEDGDINSIEQIDINTILDYKNVLLNSDILEDTMIIQFDLKKPDLIKYPIGFSDYIWNNNKYYRTNKETETDYTPGEFDYLIDSLKILLGTNKSIDAFDPNSMISSFFGEQQKDLLKSDLIKASIIDSIKKISILEFEDIEYNRQVSTWQEWTDELPYFFEAINIVLNNGNLDQLNNITFNTLLKNESRKILLNSFIIEMTLVKITVSNIDSGTLSVQNPTKEKYSDFDEKLNWYRVYDVNRVLTAESELNNLFQALEILVPGDDASQFDVSTLLSKFIVKETRTILFGSSIITETFINAIPSMNSSLTLPIIGSKEITIFIKKNNPTWEFYTKNNGNDISEIDAFLGAIEIIYRGEDITFASLINPTKLFEFFQNGTSEDKLNVNKSHMMKETLTQFQF